MEHSRLGSFAVRASLLLVNSPLNRMTLRRQTASLLDKKQSASEVRAGNSLVTKSPRSKEKKEKKRKEKRIVRGVRGFDDCSA